MTGEEAHRILSKGLVNAPSEHEWCMAFDMAIQALEQEPKTGHWIKMPIGFKCSECNELEDRTTKFCPNCGARMVETQERSE